MEGSWKVLTLLVRVRAPRRHRARVHEGARALEELEDANKLLCMLTPSPHAWARARLRMRLRVDVGEGEHG